MSQGSFVPVPEQLAFTSNLGLYGYAAAAILLGLLGLVFGDFATMAARRANVPSRAPLAYLTTVVEVAAELAPSTAALLALAV